MACEAFFLPTSAGPCFCLYHPPPGRAGGGGQGVNAGKGRPGEGAAVLFIPAFAEEMNKSRRMAALQSRALAAAGHGVLLLDLPGCGDSAGNLADATWAAWVEAVRRAAGWLRERCPGPLWLWGMRTGCLVAAEAARDLPGALNFIFWQPTPSGRLFLQQFLRLGMAGALRDGDPGGVGRELRRKLAAGEPVEVAGYTLPAGLAAGLEQAELAPAARPGRLEWLEVVPTAEAGLAPAARKCLAAWQGAGHRARGRGVGGPPFWQTVENTECPALLAATLESLAGEPAPAKAGGALQARIDNEAGR